MNERLSDLCCDQITNLYGCQLTKLNSDILLTFLVTLFSILIY